MTVDHEGGVCHGAGSPSSKPRPSHPPSWASDGEEPVPHFSTHINAIICVTSFIERAWGPTGGTDGTGSLGIRGLRAASRPHRYCNLIYFVYISSNVSLIMEIEILNGIKIHAVRILDMLFKSIYCKAGFGLRYA